MLPVNGADADNIYLWVIITTRSDTPLYTFLCDLYTVYCIVLSVFVVTFVFYSKKICSVCTCVYMCVREIGKEKKQ